MDILPNRIIRLVQLGQKDDIIHSDTIWICASCLQCAVIIATGGSGRLHIQNFMTTNNYGATADGIVMAYRAGVPISFLHTVQYHSTGVVFPENISFSEGSESIFQKSPCLFTRHCTTRMADWI